MFQPDLKLRRAFQTVSPVVAQTWFKLCSKNWCDLQILKTSTCLWHLPLYLKIISFIGKELRSSSESEEIRSALFGVDFHLFEKVSSALGTYHEE